MTTALHPFASYWDKGVRNVPDMTGARHLLDGRDLYAVCGSLGIDLPMRAVLDVGCGTGRLEQFCKGYMGVDIAQSAVDYCRAQGIDARLTVTPDDLDDLRAGPFAFQWVTSISVCTHIDRPERQAYLAKFVTLADNLLIDIIPGNGRGNVALWTADPAEFAADLVAAGYATLGVVDHKWDNQTHRYYRARRVA